MTTFVMVPGAWLGSWTWKKITPQIASADKEWMFSLSTPWPVKYATDPIVLSEKYDGLKAAHIFCTKSGSDVNELIAGKWGKD